MSFQDNKNIYLKFSNSFKEKLAATLSQALVSVQIDSTSNNNASYEASFYLAQVLNVLTHLEYVDANVEEQFEALRKTDG